MITVAGHTNETRWGRVRRRWWRFLPFWVLISLAPLLGNVLLPGDPRFVAISIRVAIQSALLMTAGSIFSPYALLQFLRRIPGTALIIEMTNTFLHFGGILAHEIKIKRQNILLRFAGSKEPRSFQLTGQMLSASLDSMFERLKRIEETRDLRCTNLLSENQNDPARSQSLEHPAADDIVPTAPLALQLIDMTLPGGSNKFSLVVGKGEWVGITGPSGIGKTTLLKVAAGLIKPTQGQVLRFGQHIDGKSVKNRVSPQTQMLFQDPWDQILGFTPYEDLSLSLRSRGEKLERSVHNRWIEDALEQVGLAGQIHQPITTLSFGERKRLGVAQFILSQPDLILCDEPTAGLDLENAKRIIDLMATMFKDKAVVWVTHDLHLLPKRLNRVVAL